MKSIDRLDITVTYLHMRVAPTRPPRPAPILDQPVTFIKVEKPRIAFYRNLYDAVGLPWLWYERCEMSDAVLASVIHDDAVTLYVLYVGGHPAGFAELDARQPPNHHNRDLHLAYFGLVTEFIGRGLGPFFLDAIIDIAWTADIKRFWLRTCSLDHPAALPVYRNAGFEEYGRERHLIPDPRVRGIIPTVANPLEI